MDGGEREGGKERVTFVDLPRDECKWCTKEGTDQSYYNID